MSAPTTLRSVSRVITTHNSSGQSIFSSTLAETPPKRVGEDGIEISFMYGTDQFPPKLDGEKDIARYDHLISNPPGIIIPDGSVARIVDLPPGYTSPMHRTISLNYNFVVQGEVELILDSGETRQLKPGDMAVQRAINHAWRNMSKVAWARITAVAFRAETAELGK